MVKLTANATSLNLTGQHHYFLKSTCNIESSDMWIRISNMRHFLKVAWASGLS